MKTQNNTLVLKKDSILELNDSQLYAVNGGTDDTTVLSISCPCGQPIPIRIPFLSIIYIDQP